MHRLRTPSILAIVLILAGCGGGSEDRLTKAEYTKEANKICKTAQTKADKATAKLENITGEDPGDADKVAGALKEAVDIFERAQGDIEELKGPEKDDKKIDAINKESRKAIKEAREITKDLKEKGDLTALGQDDPFEEYNKKATAYGLTECGF